MIFHGSCDLCCSHLAAPPWWSCTWGYPTFQPMHRQMLHMPSCPVLDQHLCVIIPEPGKSQTRAWPEQWLTYFAAMGFVLLTWAVINPALCTQDTSDLFQVPLQYLLAEISDSSCNWQAPLNLAPVKTILNCIPVFNKYSITSSQKTQNWWKEIQQVWLMVLPFPLKRLLCFIDNTQDYKKYESKYLSWLKPHAGACIKNSLQILKFCFFCKML